MTAIITMRTPCRQCQSDGGIVATVNGQDTVRCRQCNAFCYNAPKSETGREVRTLSRRNITPGLLWRVRQRDGDSCIICRSTDRPEVGHLISVADGERYGVASELINSEENLAVMCATCNSGISDETVPIRLIVKAFLTRIARTGDSTP